MRVHVCMRVWMVAVVGVSANTGVGMVGLAK